MRQLRRAALLVAIAGLSSALVAPQAQAAAVGTARLTGSLLVLPAETPGGAAEYVVQSDDGGLVGVTGDFAGRTGGGRFDGRVDVTGLVGATAPERLAGAARDGRTLRVTSYTVTAEPAAAQTTTTHRWFVAAPGNFGALGMSDAEILAKVSWVASYWKKQSNGVVTDITVPAAITRYTATATTEAGGCGLTGSDFSATVQEAAAAFPGAAFGGTDQLLLLMPPSCNVGSTTGRGTLPGRLSFANGYYSITKASPGIFEWTLAHELGHNYGFGHSSLGPCSPGCASTYGDFYSVMGGVVSGKPLPPVLGTVSRELQGVTDPGEVETVGGSATRTLLPRSATSGLRSLRVTDPGTGEVLRLDYRSGTGDDAGGYYAGGSGLTDYRPGVVVETEYAGNALQLVPGPGSRKAMVAGESLTLGSTTVEVTSMGASGATVVVTVPGAPASYTPTAGLIGHTLAVRVVASATGYLDATASSAGRVVSAAPLVLTGATTVTGVARVGEPLTCVPAGWVEPPSSVTTTVAWLSDGATVPGADTTSFVATAVERGTRMSCRVTFSAPEYASAVSTSAPSEPVAAGVLTSSKPVVRGRAKVGRTLHAEAGAWTDGVTLRYRWFVGGERLRGRHAPSLLVRGGMVGRKVTVVVIGTLAGYATVTRKSLPTAPVRP